MVEPLPYQPETALFDIEEATTTKLCFTNGTNSRDHRWEVFHVQEVNEYEEEGDTISSDKDNVAMKTDE